MQNAHVHKNNIIYIIIRCKKFFVHLFFVDGATHEFFLTTTIPLSTVYQWDVVLIMTQAKHLITLVVHEWHVKFVYSV